MAQPETIAIENDVGLWRDLVAYWILGLCNNYGYVVMLSAAHDIIGQFEEHPSKESEEVEPTKRYCHMMSTGAILLADILPSFAVKFVMPFLPFWVNTRIGGAIALSAMGFLLVAFANVIAMAFLGVILTSASCGLGETSFLAYSSRFNKNVVSTWSSGTGGAGIIGSISYAALIQVGLSPRTTILVMLLVPAIEAASFWVLLRRPPEEKAPETIMKLEESADGDAPLTSLKEKVIYVKFLLKYMIPLALVYLFEYFINQGLYELVYFDNIFMDRGAQYRWLNVDYQVGVFVSRSSVNIIHVRKIWIMPIFQFLNVVYFLFDALYFFTPSIWIIFAVVFWEGLLGGGAYVNTFYRLSQDIPPNRRLFALGMVAQSDSYGIAPAGFLAMPVHNAICKLPPVHRS